MGGVPRSRETEEGLSERKIGAEDRRLSRPFCGKGKQALNHSRDRTLELPGLGHGHGCVDHADECMKDFPVEMVVPSGSVATGTN